MTDAIAAARRRLSKSPASILPWAVLILLPKCPLCLAAWLTVVTGVGFSAAGAAWLRGMLVVFWVAAVALAVVSIIRRRAFGRASASTALKGSQSACCTSSAPTTARSNRSWKRQWPKNLMPIGL